MNLQRRQDVCIVSSSSRHRQSMHLKRKPTYWYHKIAIIFFFFTPSQKLRQRGGLSTRGWHFALFALTFVAGVAPVVAVVAGDPQDPVLQVVHPVGRHFGAAVRDDSAAATGRRLPRRVRVHRGLRPDARRLCALRSPLGACHRV